MASITLKNIPADLHKKLKARARQHGRSLNREVLQCLRLAAVSEPRDIEAELAVVREHHRLQRAEGFYTTAEEIDEFKREGRE